MKRVIDNNAIRNDILRLVWLRWIDKDLTTQVIRDVLASYDDEEAGLLYDRVYTSSEVFEWINSRALKNIKIDVSWTLYFIIDWDQVSDIDELFVREYLYDTIKFLLNKLD